MNHFELVTIIRVEPKQLLWEQSEAEWHTESEQERSLADWDGVDGRDQQWAYFLEPVTVTGDECPVLQTLVRE